MKKRSNCAYCWCTIATFVLPGGGAITLLHNKPTENLQRNWQVVSRSQLYISEYRSFNDGFWNVQYQMFQYTQFKSDFCQGFLRPLMPCAVGPKSSVVPHLSTKEQYSLTGVVQAGWGTGLQDDSPSCIVLPEISNTELFIVSTNRVCQEY